MVKTAAFAITMFTLIAALLTGSAGAGEIEKPVALDALPSVGLIVLGNRGTIYRLQGSAGQYTITKTFQIPVNQYPVDLTLAQISKEFYIFVASNMTSTLGGGGRITQYTLEGHVVNYWDVRGICAGIDFDGSSHTLYFAKSDQNEIVSIKFGPNGKAEASSLGEVREVTQIGPLAFDATGAKIYVGDIASGGIYAFDLATRGSRALVARLGSVTALRLVAARGRLIATDGQRGQVIAFNLIGKPSQTVLPIGTKLRHPSGLAMVDADLLAVADSDLGHIFFVKDSGQVVGQF